MTRRDLRELFTATAQAFTDSDEHAVVRWSRRMSQMREEADMADVAMLGLIIGFVLLCVAYVSWCGRIVGAGRSDGES